ncbi:flavin reductase family protein [Streptomyces sp. NBC_00728]|jgi:flavin reductase (DIM6/NTAB) family NADH-FMN oxidoreductase RutF|uniref:flavin reductase family protein n=1 Tax=Streptomyces sp. NBC_00728 TaxID=2903676 RepID=UPI0038655B7E
MRETLAAERRTGTAAGAQQTRATVRRLATGVAVLTCGDPDTVEGVTVSTVALASMEPPIISVALREDSRGLRSLLARDRFVVNGLASGQAFLADHFASKKRPRGLAQLPSDTWAGLSSHGVPRLKDAVAWLECHILRSTAVGDHRVIFAGVSCGSRSTGTPLVNFAEELRPGRAAVRPLSVERDR